MQARRPARARSNSAKIATPTAWIAAKSAAAIGTRNVARSAVFQLIWRTLRSSGRRSLPAFIIAFLVLSALNSLGAIPAALGSLLNDISRWSLLVAIAAVGMKTSLNRVFDVGHQAIALIVGETIFLVLFILLGIELIG